MRERYMAKMREKKRKLENERERNIYTGLPS